jgi:hypothetical protein
MMAAKTTRRGLGDKHNEDSGIRPLPPGGLALSCPPPSGDGPRSLRHIGGRAITERRHASSPRAVSLTDLAVVVDRRVLVPRLSPRTSWELARAALAPREAFLLSRVDGELTLAELADLTGMVQSEVLEILTKCASLDLVELRTP